MGVAVESSFGKRRLAPWVEPRPARVAEADRNRIAGLDLLRLIAALAVVMFHFGYRGTAGQGLSVVAYPEIAGLAKFGFLGVDLFFLISGFVIAASAEGRSAIEFGIARIGRLYPAHLACMTLTAMVIALWGFEPHRATVAQYLANLTMVSPLLGQPFMDGAYWSIMLEITFYGWVALFVALGLLERRFLTIIAAWLAVCALNETVLLLKPLRFLLLTEYGSLFASGMLMHRIWRGRGDWQTWSLLGLAFVIGLGHANEVARVFARLYATSIDVGTLHVLHVGIYAVFAVGLLASRFIAPTRLVVTLGALTYPLYLAHQNIGYVLLARLEPVIGRWPALVSVLALSLGIAWAVATFVEPKGRKLVVAALKGLLAQAGRLTVAAPAAVR